MSDNQPTVVRTLIADDAMEMAIEAMFRLYSFPHSAAVREYVANAADEHATAGVTEPVSVSLTRVSDNPAGEGDLYRLIVTDHGRGMDHDTLAEVYTQIRKSAKRDDENTVGGFGIGAKSGMAVSDEGFDVLTCTGESAHLLRSRHVTQGHLSNVIETLDPEGIDKGTTVSVTYPMTRLQLRDAMMMLHAMSLVNDIVLHLRDVPFTMKSHMTVYKVSDDSGGGETFHPYAILSGDRDPIHEEYRTYVAVARAYRRRGGVILDSTPDRDRTDSLQFRGKGVAYLANTPYPVDFDGSRDVEGIFGHADIPLGKVSVPRHRETLMGLDSDQLGETMDAIHDQVLQDLADTVYPSLYASAVDDLQEPVVDYVIQRITHAEFPDTSENIPTSRGDLVAHLAQRVAKEIRNRMVNTVNCPGLLVFSNKTSEDNAYEKGIYPVTETMNMARTIATMHRASYSSSIPPFAVIRVQDMPEHVQMSKTEAARVRYNIRRMFPHLIDPNRGFILVRSVPENVWIAEKLNADLTSSRLKVTHIEDPDTPFADPDTPCNGLVSWKDLSTKITRVAASSDRTYMRYVLGEAITITEPITDKTTTVDASDDAENVDSRVISPGFHSMVTLSLDDSREMMERDDVLFVVNSRDLQRHVPEDYLSYSVFTRLAKLPREQHTVISDADRELLMWNGIKEVYVYAEDAASTIRKDITRHVLRNLQRMGERAEQYQEHLNDKATDESQAFAPILALRTLVAALTGASDRMSVVGGIVEGAINDLETLGVSGIKRHHLARAIKAEITHEDLFYCTNDMVMYGGPLYNLPKGVRYKILTSVLGSESVVHDLATMSKVSRPWQRMPISLAETAQAVGGLDALAEMIDESFVMNNTRQEVAKSSVLYQFARSRVEAEVERFYTDLDTFTTMVTGGEVSLARLMNDATAVLDHWRSSTQEPETV